MEGQYARIRHMAMGAVAALAVVGAIAGANALAAKPRAPKPPPSPQAFVNDVQQLVDNGTITPAEARTVDREIVAGRVDTDTLTASGFTQVQLDAVQQALRNTKRALAATAHGTTK